MGLKLITAPSLEPVSLTEARLQCRVDTTDEDALITLFIAAARAKAENYTGQCIMAQTWEQTADAWPAEATDFMLLRGPVTAITSVTYRDANGATQTLGNSLYTLDASSWPGWLLPATGTTWPSVDGSAGCITVRYTAGVTTQAAVPADLRAWLLMTVATLYAQRESMVLDGKVAEIPSRFVDRLLDPYKLMLA